jgi:hypothetical protein
LRERLVTSVKARVQHLSVTLIVEDDFASGDLRDLFTKKCVKLRLDAAA